MKSAAMDPHIEMLCGLRLLVVFVKDPSQFRAEQILVAIPALHAERLVAFRDQPDCCRAASHRVERGRGQLEASLLHIHDGSGVEHKAVRCWQLCPESSPKVALVATAANADGLPTMVRNDGRKFRKLCLHLPLPLLII